MNGSSETNGHQLSYAIPAPVDSDRESCHGDSDGGFHGDAEDGEDIALKPMATVTNGDIATRSRPSLTRSSEDEDSGSGESLHSTSDPASRAQPETYRCPKKTQKIYPEESISPDVGIAESVTRKPGAWNWKETLYQYSQSASLHGLRQITEPQSFFIRRMLWVLLLLACVVLFGYQMIQAIVYYRSWPASVNINIKHNESIRFPAVTLCNQNAFRLSAARHFGHLEIYELASQFYNHQRGRVPFNLSAYPGAGDLYISEIFTQAAHRRDGLIVDCFWDGARCHDDDIVVTLTDFGVCYTFNSGVRSAEVKYATHTGSQSGLQLRLNIEQYEYTKGPNSGAGIKLHLHNQGDIALVKDHGMAVSPGTHALVAVDVVEIHNLEPPHGECSRDVTLEYYKHYSKASCMMDCLQRHVIERCDCRDFYMPLGNSTSPMCTLKEYFDCFIEASQEYNSQKAAMCKCPVLCDFTVFKPSVSYGSTSNLDTDALLRSDASLELQKQFVHARESSQRVNKDVVSKDEVLINNFVNIVHDFNTIFESWNKTIAYTRYVTNGIYRELHKRHDFHSRVGLGNIKYVIRNDFVRGWEVMEERGVGYVATNFYDVLSTFDRFIEFANSSSSTATREAAWFSVQSMLKGRRQLALRSADNISEAVTAFTEGKRLLNYEGQISERYDQAFAALPLLVGDYKSDVEEYHDGIKKHLHSFIDSLETLLAMGQNVVNNNTVVDNISLEMVKEQFIEASKGYNYERYRFGDRLVRSSLDRVQKNIDEFEAAWKDVVQACNEMSTIVLDIEMILQRMQRPWQAIQLAASHGSMYLTNTNLLKTPYATDLTNQLGVDVNELQVSFRDLRSNAQIQRKKWYKMEAAVRFFWDKIILEHNLGDFYRLVHEDFQSFIFEADTPAEKMKYAELFFKMLEAQSYLFSPHLNEAADILNQTEAELVVRLSADVHKLFYRDKWAQLNDEFRRYAVGSNLVNAMGNRDEYLLQVIDDLLKDMRQYLDGNRIDATFYRENFLRVDVFLKELSYEKITQQEDYDVPKLLSGIGGSIGLFIGASVLSFFEFLDVIILHPIGMHRRG